MITVLLIMILNPLSSTRGAEFFKEYNFLLGVSLDGPKDIHNKFRLTENGKPTHSKVMEGINHLCNAKAEFNITLNKAKKHSIGKSDQVFF